ncbi:hypothetical protein [Neobacillus mesonae]|uniref:toxin-antitoxin system YwqK family antitoxin n=1 Tax=Neobacillus mesonae TaxID=1193713 RepID=UPI00203DDFAC|nr:hypothetical protein [Neobacillus mesonae]MCM3569787.1 hypothetical protein [Neobacillus mesonae]
MNLEIQLLSKDEVLINGVNFDEKLWFTSYSDEVIDNPEDKGGKPFSGLAFELYDNGNLAYYGYYRNGLKEGPFVEFYPSGKIKGYRIMDGGTVKGKEIMWFENGQKAYEGESRVGRRLTYTKWNETGEIIEQKTEPTKFDLEYVKKFDN